MHGESFHVTELIINVGLVTYENHSVDIKWIQMRILTCIVRWVQFFPQNTHVSRSTHIISCSSE